MADANSARALTVVKRVVEMCDFIEDPAIRKAVEQEMVPRTMPGVVNALVDISVWAGLGTVGLWAALDAFADRAGLKKSKCPTCHRSSCIWMRFAPYPLHGNEGQSLRELEDFRHLYAHNYAGEADAEYFRWKRHVLAPCMIIQLTCGAQFNGDRLLLDLKHLRYYASTVQSVLARFP